MSTELVHIGFGNIIAANKMVAIASPNSAPTRRLVQEAKKKGLLLVMSSSRRTKAVIIAENGYHILSALAPETIMGRVQALHGGGDPKIITDDEENGGM